MEIDAYRGLEPARVWGHFAALNAIPRPSGHEEAARKYVLGVADAAGLDSHVDTGGNTIVRVPPTGGAAGPVIAIQAHLDMVCEAAPGVAHDCRHDPIAPRRDDDRVFAEGTTLGADNGIGVAASLALIDAPEIRHGGLELIFTTGEEDGQWSAFELDPADLTAEALINLDSEDADALTIGSAGGSDVEVTLPLRREQGREGLRGAELRLEGLGGGHSGMQIHERRANAIKLLAEALGRLPDLGAGLSLVSISGGSAHNAIPRTARARLGLTAERMTEATAAIEAFRRELRDRWGEAEPDLTLELTEGPAPSSVIADRPARALLALVNDLPHGVLAMSARFPDVVETSANLATIRAEGEAAKIFTSVRSLSASSREETEDRVRRLASAAGASAEVRDGYPSWPPRERSPLLEAAAGAYRRVYAREPRIDVIHGGLECGAIVAAKPNLDAISFGPTIRDAHTPREHVLTSTVATTWQLLVTLLDDLTYGS